MAWLGFGVSSELGTVGLRWCLGISLGLDLELGGWQAIPLSGNSVHSLLRLGLAVYTRLAWVLSPARMTGVL